MNFFECPGIGMPQPLNAPPEGYVACYVAGHECQSTVKATEDESSVTHRCFCQCCGRSYWTMSGPREWWVARAGDRS